MEHESGPSTGPIVLGGSGENRLEGSDDRRIELRLNRLRETQSGDPTRHGVTIGPGGRHRVIRVGNGDDPSEERNFIALELIWIAKSVDSLVMMPDDRRDLGVIVDVRQDPFANHRVLLHLPPLLQRQRARLLKKSRSQSNLSDVVHEATEVS